ncbi:MAG: aromatic amino acid ammonia-lyase [Sodaliphilus pleomorphus]|uniref:HAL/PAL/TAL family ammonia-lyase n=1 Tax=Sodaliphilus pleomorphus TaxID=2606626 RepID=UPI002409A5E3|nr:aromatic amino acid ammonia-lyase [Sodaliphilus pleomorphus]MDD6474247.1 aromatic amino acid ammonia-lyase [Sodaliphilus pleomorphus]
MQTPVFSLEDVSNILYSGKIIDMASLPLDDVEACYEFLKKFAADKVIYGINTGFGPMAQWRVDDKHLKDLQYNIIRSHATGAGAPLDDTCVKAAMIARAGTLLQARSGVHPDAVRLLVQFINRGIFPFIPEHGSVGASGDLVQLAHMALTLIGEGQVHYKGQWRDAGEVLRINGLQPLQIHIREGLSLTNGTSVMTGIGIVNQFMAERLLDWSIAAAVWINEIASSYDDMMSEELNAARRHEGQQRVARCMRKLAQGSQCLRKRQHELYDSSHRDTTTFEHKVQAYYSLRCTPQILGPIAETLACSRRVLEEELNSACDNPIVDPVAGDVLHGGNFHGDYISLEQDKVKIALVRLAMTAERQLNYLMHDRINGILPPFLNMGTLGLNYGMQACQFTATSTTAECQTLAMPNYVHSIPNNNDNQDIVSMGTNTALLTKRVIENCCQVMAILYIALAQATDCLDIAAQLAPASRKTYDEVRERCPKTVDDTPFYREIDSIEQYLKSHDPIKDIQAQY